MGYTKNQFITGNKLKYLANYFYESEYVYIEINDLNPPNQSDLFDIYYIKSDFIKSFFEKNWQRLEEKPFKIITHNSDFGVTMEYMPFLNHPNLIHWYGQNIDIEHTKLSSIPIGIANEEWPHGNLDVLNDVIGQNIKKDIVSPYFNFSTWTNIRERSACESMALASGLEKNKKEDFENYLKSLSRHYFCLSPNGNGVDCHKTWECLYLGVCPIVTKSVNSSFYKRQWFPIIEINSWLDLPKILNGLNEELYIYLWQRFESSKDKLSFEYFKNKIQQK